MRLPIALSSCLAPVLLSLAAQSTGAQPDARDLDPGVTVRIYRVESDLSAIPTLAPDQTPNSDRLVPNIDLAEEVGFDGTPAPLVTVVTGWLLIREAGACQFRLTSDDGSRLLIDGRLVIDHDGRHGATAIEGRPIDLELGLHELRVEHFDHGGRKRLLLEWRREDGEYEVIPESSLRTERDLTRVTSPGFKAIADGRRAGDGKPLEGVHPGWRVETIRPEGFEPMVGAMAFDSKGRLIVGTFNPLQRDEESLPDIESKEPDKLFAVEGYEGGSSPEVHVVADGFYEPAGLCAVGEDLYVSHRKAITRLRDLDGDGFFEDRKDIAAGWEGWNYHQFVFGLVHLDGKLYATLSTAMAPPKWEGMGTNAAPNGPMRGGILEVDLSVEDPELATRIIAGGTRTPNGIGLGPDNTLWYLDNQGTWMSTSQMAQVIPGRFYGHYNRSNFVPNLADRFPDGGHPSAFAGRPRTSATLYMPQNEVSNSPTEPVLIEDGLFAGQMLIGELTAGGIRRAFLEKVNGQYQGALLRFTQGLECGVNRVAWGPDGALYAGGIGAGGNWNWRQTKFGLQRLIQTGEIAYEIHSINASPAGFEIYFTQEPEWSHLTDLANFTIKQWRYEHTAEYGGPKVDQEILPVTGIRTHLERVVGAHVLHGVRIRVDGLRTGRCVHIRVDPPALDGDTLWSPEAWYTLNELPGSPPVSKLGPSTIDPAVTGVGVGVLPPADAVTLLGASADMAFRKSSEPQMPSSGGRSQDDLLGLPGYVEVGKGSGNLVSSTVFGDCRLHIEWYSPPGGVGQLAGNSGVYLQDAYEIQVLGTKSVEQGGPDQPELNEAGAIYNIKRPDANASNGPGAWQAYDIWFRAPRFKSGEKTENARVTVYWNGQLIHNDVAIPRPTGGRAGAGEPGPAGGTGIQTGPLFLQDHASMAEGAVRYRNIWIAPLDDRQYASAQWNDLLDETWTVRGGEAAIDIESDEVVGHSRPSTPNTFLVTEREFGDFELLLETKQDIALNSGIMIRSEVVGGFDNRSGGLRGYQVELDASDRAYSGGIYEERGRAWLHPLIDAPYARRAFRPGDWNRVRIVAQGPVIRTWINGVPAAEIFDAHRERGCIGLQVHGVGAREDELQVRFRNLRLRELSPRR